MSAIRLFATCIYLVLLTNLILYFYASRDTEKQIDSDSQSESQQHDDGGGIVAASFPCVTDCDCNLENFTDICYQCRNSTCQPVHTCPIATGCSLDENAQYRCYVALSQMRPCTTDRDCIYSSQNFTFNGFCSHLLGRCRFQEYSVFNSTTALTATTNFINQTTCQLEAIPCASNCDCYNYYNTNDTWTWSNIQCPIFGFCLRNTTVNPPVSCQTNQDCLDALGSCSICVRSLGSNVTNTCTLSTQPTPCGNATNQCSGCYCVLPPVEPPIPAPLEPPVEPPIEPPLEPPVAEPVTMPPLLIRSCNTTCDCAQYTYPAGIFYYWDCITCLNGICTLSAICEDFQQCAVVNSTGCLNETLLQPCNSSVDCSQIEQCSECIFNPSTNLRYCRRLFDCPENTECDVANCQCGSVQVPVELPAESPIEGPVEIPIEGPVQVPVELPAGQPLESPIQEPLESPLEPPLESPLESPSESPVTTPLEPPVATPLESPIATPLESPIEAPSENPIATPLESPITAPLEPPIINQCTSCCAKSRHRKTRRANSL